MPTVLDRWLNVPPDAERIKVTGAEYMDLIRGDSIIRGSGKLVLDDGPFRIVTPAEITKRGGPGSGHHGHRGREGKVGGSLPGREGVTRPVPVKPGKRLLSKPIGGIGIGQEMPIGARRWIVVTEEEYKAIKNRTIKEEHDIAFETSLTDRLGSKTREQRIGEHGEGLGVMAAALERYVEENRPRGGWTYVIRGVADDMRRAAEAYSETGDEKYLRDFWDKNGGLVYEFMNEGDEKSGLPKLRDQNSPLMGIVRDMSDSPEFSGSGLKYFMNAYGPHHVLTSFSMNYDLDLIHLKREREGFEATDRWTSAVDNYNETMEVRGEEIGQTATNIADRLQVFGSEYIELEKAKGPIADKREEVTEEINQISVEIDGIISAGGAKNVIFSKIKPLQVKRDSLYLVRSKLWDDTGSLKDLQGFEVEGMRKELIDQIQALNPEAGQGTMLANVLSMEEGGWAEFGKDWVGDATFWEILYAGGDEKLIAGEEAKAKKHTDYVYNKQIVPGMNDAQEFLNAIVPRSMLPGTEVTVRYDADEDLRAHYQPGSDEIALEIGNGASTSVHEIGHFIEDKNEQIENAAVGFLLSRGEGKPIKTLNEINDTMIYDAWERAFDGALNDPYSAKVYYSAVIDDYRSTEIVSQGLEKLYDNPLVFSTSDPEHYEFMIALLTGKLTE